MQAIPSTTIDVSLEEREILIELLDRERTNLPTEIHHTRTAKFRDALKHRLDVIEALFRRLAST
jgi:hypothetical protein